MTWYIIASLVAASISIYGMMGAVAIWVYCKINSQGADDWWGMGLIWPFTLPAGLVWLVMKRLDKTVPKVADLPKAKVRVRDAHDY